MSFTGHIEKHKQMLINNAAECVVLLKKDGKFDTLNSKLKEIALLREEFSDLSLEELATKCSYKISKSGVNHRLNKIVKIAEEE